MDVSTTNAAVGYYALYTPGANSSQEFSSVLGGAITGGSFTIPFAQPFLYTPSTGNLLLQLNISGGPSNPGGLGLYTMSNGGGLFSRAYDVNSGSLNLNFADSTGLVTQFDTAGSPSTAAEPRDLLVPGVGLIAGAIRMCRKSDVIAAETKP